MDINDFAKIWNVVGDMSRMTANAYRIFIALCVEGESTQSNLCKRYNWLKSSVSESTKKLYDMKLVDCKIVNRRITYFVDEKKFDLDIEMCPSVSMDMKTFKILWDKVADMSKMSANCFRVYIDICLYGATTQKELWERRGWKIAGVSGCFQKLYDWGLLICNNENGKKIYSVKLDLDDI